MSELLWRRAVVVQAGIEVWLATGAMIGGVGVVVVVVVVVMIVRGVGQPARPEGHGGGIPGLVHMGSDGGVAGPGRREAGAATVGGLGRVGRVCQWRKERGSCRGRGKVRVPSKRDGSHRASGAAAGPGRRGGRDRGAGG